LVRPFGLRHAAPEINEHLVRNVRLERHDHWRLGSLVLRSLVLRSPNLRLRMTGRDNSGREHRCRDCGKSPTFRHHRSVSL
jgi:hypothetical protein